MNLSDLARPMTRAEALASGALIDTTAAASWMGFRVPAAVTAAVWAEIVGDPGAHATAAERLHGAQQLRLLWKSCQEAVLLYRSRGIVLGAVRFRCPGAKSGRPVALRAISSVECGQSVLTLLLDGECC